MASSGRNCQIDFPVLFDDSLLRIFSAFRDQNSVYARHTFVLTKDSHCGFENLIVMCSQIFRYT
ncbi:hypothetical protein SERLADRAFT_471384 [Serpula lacrymans var. lacrymans S7.9]|uniref:Uncharacterized protein n=1 Tax=Serpula lacrymans var. lacrymans (strain S7.9) TaxID=578457 RepID=F8P144_SERL9|nr:uncharacterized protein SERLADRAFT_471384 [Serpula lacrymans var. lacrymans S7.9]EGO22875.1 hypothetical protein SERLADRAFT_471384 [Serpula lacrymans var. lacrymans S7.9]